MRSLIFLSGMILDDGPVLSLARKSEQIICADGGIRHARRLGCRPDFLIGDLDSADDNDLCWAECHRVPIRRVSPQKDETDTELAVLAALEKLPPPADLHEIILAGAFGSRPDHVLATQLMAARLAVPGLRFHLTDGQSSLYTLVGGQVLTLDLPVYDEIALAVSAIPISRMISGLTYQGLLYPLEDATMERGSTRGVSNRAAKSPVVISLGEGALFVVVTPEK